MVVEQRHRLGEGVLPLQPQHVGHGLVVGEELDELGDPPVVAELLLDRAAALRAGAALVPDHQLEPGHDERRLSGTPEQTLELERRVLGEDLAVGPEPDAGAGLALGDPFALAGQARLRGERARRPVSVEDAGHAALEAQPLLGRRPVDVDVHPRREGVDDRESHAVQTAGRDVGATAELAAGVELGRDHLDAGEPGLGLLVGRDAATVVVDLHGVVRVEGDLDPVGRAGQRLIDAVVDDLPQAVHEATGVGRADVHAGALAHRLESLEDEEVGRVVGVVGDGDELRVELNCPRSIRGTDPSWLLLRIYPRHAVRRSRLACRWPGRPGSTVGSTTSEPQHRGNVTMWTRKVTKSAHSAT